MNVLALLKYCSISFSRRIRPGAFLLSFLLIGSFNRTCAQVGGAENPANRTAERIVSVENPVNKTLIKINLPSGGLDPRKKTWLVFYALPNGNSIEWTMGKKISGNDDWHFDIQHIAAQTRYIRSVASDRNVVVVYLANELKSWPAWKRSRTDGPQEIRRIVDSITNSFAVYKPEIILNSHSGGGSFLFGYLDAVKEIPDQVSRIAFIDSDYGYEDSLHTAKLARWLQSSRKHQLTVLAYNDSVVIYNGKPLVSPTGGTWYRTKLMQQKLAGYFPFKKVEDTAMIHYTAISNRIDILLKINPNGQIYHTEQVARNGFIHTVIGNTPYERKAGYRYWTDRVYSEFIRPEPMP